MLPSNYQCTGQMTIIEYFQESQFGKTSPELSAQTVEKTSDVSLKSWQESKTPKFQFLNLRSGGVQDGLTYLMDVSHGAHMTLSIGGSPNEEIESHLSWILETNPNPKYNLSPLACQGILRRAKTRGKKLPELLERVLIQQSASKNEAENLGGVRESSYSTTTQEHCQPSTTKLYCNVCKENVCFADTHNALNADDGPKGVHSQMMNAPESNFVVSYGISSYDSNAMKSPNPNSGIYEAETSKMLDNNGGNPACNQGGIIVLEGNGSRPSHKGDGFSEADVSYTLNAVEHHAVCVGVDAYNQATTGDKSKSLNSAATDSDPIPCVCYGLDRASFNQGQNAKQPYGNRGR